MSDNKNSNNVKLPSMSMEDDDIQDVPKVKNKISIQSSGLKLDETNHRPSKTRGELYKELTKNERQMEEEDYFEFAHPFARGIALLMDMTFAFFTVQFGLLSAPYEVKMIHMFFLDKYKLQFILGEEAFIKVITAANISIILFLCIVIPVAFFNVSLGKKITSLRIRGDQKYTLGISQAFQREIIFKPISIIVLVGFILPFFDKKKKSLHDKMAGTFVIKE